jgi:uncharacterized OB-fold protein
MRRPLPPSYRCKKCGRVTTYARLRCLSCRGTSFERIPLPETGSLVAFTEVHMLPWGFDERFLRFGIVRFPDGAVATGRIAFGGAKSGMTVRASWEPVRGGAGDETYGFVFHLPD